MSLDPEIISIYTDEIIALSDAVRAPKHLESPTIKARAVSPICGSEVEIELLLKGALITAIGYDTEACALTRAAVAILAQAAIGKTRDDIARAGQEMQSMLEDGVSLPSGAFKKLALLAPVRDYPARHNALLLPFEAVERAFKA